MDRLVSVVIRCLTPQEGKAVGRLVRDSTESDIDLVVVSGGKYDKRYEEEGCRIVESRARRFEALRIGAEHASGDTILFLDSDQRPDKSLVPEIAVKDFDAFYIPERSFSPSLLGTLLDIKRWWVERVATRTPVPWVPVVPRAYRKTLVMRAFDGISDLELSSVHQHEDSLLFLEAWKLRPRLEWTDSLILNKDPNIATFLRKSYEYGRMQGVALHSGHLTSQHAAFLRSLDQFRVVNWSQPGINVAVAIDSLKVLPYLAGYLRGQKPE